MSMSTPVMERGIELWRTGQREEARNIFAASVKKDRQNETAWIWHIFCQETAAQKIAALETFTSIFPNHTVALKALETLKREGTLPAGHFPNTQTFPRTDKTQRPAQRTVTAKRPRTSIALWALTVVCVFLLVGGSAFFASQYSALQAEHQTLKNDNEAMIQNYARLMQDYQSLKSTNSYLVYEYNGLNSRYDTLSSKNLMLAEEYSALADNYDHLNDIAVKPPYILVHDRKVDTVFYDIHGKLVSWETPFSDLEYDIENGARTRDLIVDKNWQAVSVSNQAGSLILLRDFSVFITPETFENVIPELYKNSPQPREFIYQTWHMIGQLANYTGERMETPRYPLETLLAGGGDCEDLSILLASMIKAAPVDWYIDLVFVDSKNINNPVEPDHIVVYINTGSETFLVEATSDDVMEPYTEGVTGWLAGQLRSDKNPQPVYLH